MRLENDLVNQYKNAISTLFKTVSFEKDSLGNKNSFYYSDIISKFSNLITKKYQSNKALKTEKEIENFNRITIDLLKDIVLFFIAVDNYNSRDRDNEVADDIILSKTNLDDGFKNLGQFDLKIKDYFSKKKSSIAMKEYCLKVIKESFYLLNNKFYIDIEKCPLKFDFDYLIYKLERSIQDKVDDIKPTLNSKNKTPKKIPEKWYALLHWFELMISAEQPHKDPEGNFIKSKIEEIGRIKCNRTGQSFYKSFIDIDIDNHKLLDKRFGKGWKEVVKNLSHNNPEISIYIDEKYIT